MSYLPSIEDIVNTPEYQEYFATQVLPFLTEDPSEILGKTGEQLEEVEVN